MGNAKKKVEPKMIQASELFCLHTCPKCGGYLSIAHWSSEQGLGGVVLGVFCLNSECSYKGERELI